MEDWVRHTGFTEPGGHAPAIAALTSDPKSLLSVVRGLLIHSDFLPIYGLQEEDFSHVSRQTLSLEQRLDQVLETDNRPLSMARTFTSRGVGTCRDYAVMTCGMLRSKSVPARVRCGFAKYFVAGRFEDHWICEYWRRNDRRWARADAQLDERHQQHLDISFDTSDLPAEEFLTAAEAWRIHRDVGKPAELFGHGDATGEWFMGVNLARDYLALHNQETSPWDTWRVEPAKSRKLNSSNREVCDEIASRIVAVDQQSLAIDDMLDVIPFWLR
jgi:hypothetical protein